MPNDKDLSDSESSKSYTGRKPKDTGRFFDVSSPGKVYPDTSSRPLIVGHRGLLKQDPMVASGTVKGSDEDEEISSDESGQKENSQTMADNNVNKGDEKDAIQPSFSNSIIDPPTPNADKSIKDQPKNFATDSKESVTKSASVPVAQHLHDQKTETAEQEEQARAQVVERLVEERKYALIIDAKSRKQILAIAVLILIIILVASVFIVLAMG